MLLNTIETVAENEEPGLKCLYMTVQRDSVLLVKERFNISSSKYIYTNSDVLYIYMYMLFAPFHRRGVPGAIQGK